MGHTLSMGGRDIRWRSGRTGQMRRTGGKGLQEQQREASLGTETPASREHKVCDTVRTRQGHWPQGRVPCRPVAAEAGRAQQKGTFLQELRAAEAAVSLCSFFRGWTGQARGCYAYFTDVLMPPKQEQPFLPRCVTAN